MGLPLGVRLNNPGNIRLGLTKWAGMSTDQPDASFIKFKLPEYGLRAMVKILITYHKKHKLNTVRKIITRYAPPVENDTTAYMNHVAAHIGLGVDEEFDDIMPLIIPLSEVIVMHENGRPGEGYPAFWYDKKTYEKAKTMALMGAL